MAENNLVAAAVLSGNRNFEGRINSLVKANYLASPPLVVAYALAGTMDLDLTAEPLGTGRDGHPVYLHDVWPSPEEIEAVSARAVVPQMFRDRYRDVFGGQSQMERHPRRGRRSVRVGAIEHLRARTSVPAGFVPPNPGRFARSLEPAPSWPSRDSVTTDHISPAGSIAKSSPAERT